MMEEQGIATRPEFDSEIEAQITSLGAITSNFRNVKEKAIEIKDFYSNVIYNEENLATAKADRANINKYKKSVSDYRKNLQKEFNKPFLDFETLAKETEKILDETSEIIGKQINMHEQIKVNEKIEKLKRFFEEYKIAAGIDWISYEDMNQKVNLSDSDKKLQGEIVSWLSNISKDLELIKTQEYADEILIEYKDGLDLRNSITKVKMRKQLLKVNEEMEKNSKQFVADLNKFVDAQKEEILSKPIEESIENEEIKQTTFIVRGTMSQLTKLKTYIEENGMEIVK